MVTRTQLDRLTSRVEKLANVLDPNPPAQVPVYDCEAEQEALAVYEVECGPPGRDRQIVFKRIYGETRAEVRPADHLLNCMSSEEIAAMLKEIEGKTRGLPAQYNVGRFAISKPGEKD